MMTDPIADMLTRIRNAAAVKKDEVEVPYSKLKAEILKILEQEGYILGSAKIEKGSLIDLQIKLKYTDGQSAISDLKRISKPGRRVYTRKDKLPVVLNKLGTAVISTSQGIMTNRAAKKAGLGGEVICEIY
ncbi:MAG: 30S ribosomal protein S8 [Patescibacteria group bacterium]